MELGCPLCKSIVKLCGSNQCANSWNQIKIELHILPIHSDNTLFCPQPPLSAGDFWNKDATAYDEWRVFPKSFSKSRRNIKLEDSHIADSVFREASKKLDYESLNVCRASSKLPYFIYVLQFFCRTEMRNVKWYKFDSNQQQIPFYYRFKLYFILINFL